MPAGVGREGARVVVRSRVVRVLLEVVLLEGLVVDAFIIDTILAFDFLHQREAFRKQDVAFLALWRHVD